MKQLFKPFFSASVLAFLFLLFATPVHAATFSVNSTNDAVDANPGDGICASAANECTLRAAVQEANASAGADVITLQGGQTYTITLIGADDEGNVGDFDITSEVEVNSTGTSTIDGGGVSSIFDLFQGADVTLRNLTLQNGATENINIGTAIHINDGGSISVFDSVITNNQNTAIVSLGAADFRRTTISNNTGSQGGAVYNIGFMAFVASTLSNNSASEGGAAWNTGTLFFDNSTISGNTAFNNGGAVLNTFGSVVFSSSTIVNNQGLEGAGGVASTLGEIDQTFFMNSIIANNTNGNCSGPTTSNGFNLSSDGTCGFAQSTDLENTDPMLGGLANNGGPTQTHALLAGSPAIDTGLGLGCFTTDQRGVTRPQGSACDRGAYEFDGTVTPPTPGTSDIGGTSGATSPAPNEARPPMCTENAPAKAPVLTILSKTATTVTLSWTSVDPVTHYALSFTRNSDGAQYGSTDIGKNGVYTVEFLNKGETYTFEVFGVNGCMPGPRSNKVSTKKVVKPVAPAETKGGQKGGNQDYWTKEEMNKVVGEKDHLSTSSSAVLAIPSASLSASGSAQPKNFIQSLNKWILAIGVLLAGILWFILPKKKNKIKSK